MSKINLPPLPPLPEQTIIDVIPCDEGDWPIDGWNEDELRIWAIAYAEQAVREALAAQEPVAWMTEDGRVSTDVTKRTAMPTASQVVFSIPLALIPENDHG